MIEGGTVNLKRLIKSFLREALLICVTAALAIAAIQAYAWFTKKQTAVDSGTPVEIMSGPLASVGSVVPLSGVQFSDSPVSWVLISSPTCRYCDASIPFHAKLRKAAEEHHAAFLVVVPDSNAASSYLARLGVKRRSSREWHDLGVRVPGTPTLIAVDATGVARRMWVGRVSPSTEDEVLNIITTADLTAGSGAGLRHGRDYRQEDIDRLRANNRTQLLIPRERAEQPPVEGAIIIPLMELEVRAPFELSKDLVQLVDCSNVSSQVCENAVGKLSHLGFQVASMGDGALVQSCAVTQMASN